MLVVVLLSPLVGSAHLAFAQNGTSNNFELNDAQTDATTFQHSSGSFLIDGSIEPIVGDISSGSFGAEIGTPTNSGSSTATPDPAGPTYGYLPAGEITIDRPTCLVGYGNLVTLNGTHTEKILFVTVNNSGAGVFFPSAGRWGKVVFLNAGSNELVVRGQDANGRSTLPTTIILERRTMGDINGDGRVDDYDLSLLIRKWNARNDCATDLNRDGITDDYDLSLLVSAWTN